MGLEVLLSGLGELDSDELEAIFLSISVGRMEGFDRNFLPTALEAADDGADQATL